MAFSLFKKKDNKSKLLKEDKKEKEVREEKPETGKLSMPEGNEHSYRIIEYPHVSEKASNISQIGQYVFRVYKEATKVEIAKAVEKLYGVNVSKVNIIYTKSKTRRLGKHRGKKPGYKKAVVFLKKGQTVNLISK